ncbi:MAG TPA: NAD(P)-dependent oxidoreductase, partial [bacterium]|nr:NAD(P)-dependent oxidoreductase [bacterium]
NAVAKELLMRGYNVSIFDINDDFENDGRIKFIKGDILDFNAVSDAIKDKAIVYNFAGIVDLEIANQQPYNTLKTNVLGNLNILEACKNHKVEKYIFASTIYVYSDKGAFYRCSKQMSELMIETYSKKFELKYTILRYGSVYGPNAQKNNWINDVLEQALKNKKIIRYGDGNELREYIHIYDAARASVDILDEKFDNENVILTGNTAIKIKDLLFMIKEMFNNEIEIEYLPGNYDEHYEITPYTFKPKLGKKYLINPHIDLGQGLLDLLYKMNKPKNIE